MSQNLKNILQKYVEEYKDDIDAIIISDKDSVELSGGYAIGEDKLKETQSVMSKWFVTVISSTSENLMKLHKTKAKSMTLFFQEHLIYVENWENLVLLIFAKENANLGIIYQVAKDLQQIQSKLNNAYESLKQ
ncbi:hypothetical protein PPERSA_00424 [Pseudocohnilembus persalinus]|uniref:Roadblock/LAMTOR2 domain-containing protein n=1 Tax=Pseudocohnilembus persalinus TaxID=266149 RepID=A0A0V0Q9D7_PSEPJ|nr:hypothetical protein PPERSA_00424 [Pseudocohnilembus persalinus]|eukprot:KRW98835.1 hypothetical protein PPERSA_00424 [Pseudocohnilembus persalinus]